MQNPAQRSEASPPEPDADCPLCPRLAAFRAQNRLSFPGWHNAPVGSFGEAGAPLLIVGLAPGLKGANRTGRPFTGDFAGDLLYLTLLKFGFATGSYDRRPDDGLRLTGCRIANAVRCVPPENRPTPAETATCRRFLGGELAANPRAVLALGAVAHGSTIAAAGERPSRYRFAHGAQHALGNGLRLFDSYHCSRYNTQTGRLTEAMFRDVFAAVRAFVDAGA